MTDFQTTQWSWLKELQTTNDERLEAWTRLYRNPMVQFLMRRGIREDDSEDFVQSFLLRLVTDRKFFLQVDRKRGRFRDYLRASLLNFVRDSVRRDRSRKRHPGAGRLLALGEIDLNTVVAPNSQADRTFDRTIALERFVEAVSAWKPECQARDPRRWEVFRQRFLIPFVRQTSPPSYKKIFASLGYASWKQAANSRPYILAGILGKMRQVVRQHLLRTLDLAGEREREFQEIWQRQFEGRPLGENERMVLERCAQRECELNIDAMVNDEVSHLVRLLREEVGVTAGTPSGENTVSDEPHGEAGSGSRRERVARQLQADASVERLPRRTAGMLRDILDDSPSGVCQNAIAIRSPHYDLRAIAQFWLEDELDGRTHRDWCQTMRMSFQREMDSPVGISPARRETRDLLPSVGEAGGLLVRSLSDVLQHPHPPVELLRMVKEYAQASCTRSRETHERQIFTVIYFASVVAAEIRGNASISRIDEEELRQGVKWTTEQDWVDRPTKSLMQSWLARRLAVCDSLS